MRCVQASAAVLAFTVCVSCGRGGLPQGNELALPADLPRLCPPPPSDEALVPGAEESFHHEFTPYVVVDPYAYVLAVRSCGASLERFFLDVNDDGTPEVFVACTSDRGTGGNTFHAFLQVEGGYRLIGRMFLATIWLTGDRHEGYRGLWTWARLSGTEGAAYGPHVSYRWDGSRYVEIRRETARLVDLGAIDPITRNWRPGHPPRTEYCADYRAGNRDWVSRR
jgi:hypothetical protein